MACYRVLIVDDHRDIRHLFAEALRSLSKDMDILEMPSAEEALFVTAGTHVDLLISDVYLPGISGLEMVKRLKKSNPTLKIILVTGAADPKVKDEVASAGAAAFFYKPINISDLIQTVRQFREAEAGESISPQPDQRTPVQVDGTKPTATLDLESHLAELQDQLKARAVALLSDDGILLAQSGDYAGFVGEDLAGRLRAAFQAGLLVCRSMKTNEPHNLMSFSGPDYWLCLVPVGNSFSLAVVGSQTFYDSLLRPGRRLAACADELLKILDAPKPSPDFLEASSPEPQVGLVDELPVVLPPEEIPAAEPSPEDVAALNDVFNQSGDKSLHPEELDDFWDKLAEQSEADGSDGQSIISYDEAQKRGLTTE